MRASCHLPTELPNAIVAAAVRSRDRVRGLRDLARPQAQQGLPQTRGLEGLRGEDSIAELCRKEGINQKLYYRWSKEFLEAGKKRPAKRSALPPEKFCDRQNGSSRGTYLLSRSKPRNSTTARLASFSRRFASSPSRLSELRQLLRCEHTYNLSDFPC